eukprot:TRINITY_DN8649_c0_g2_i1.p1 TRINITY_DN8649_c0_g2~~TRINITY_DN8649_c0_g2_i1.p1  ORF type:complete len:179 (+),score=8.12 TRINITY_DN8649_c0_g2_i1:157-693(+)
MKKLEASSTRERRTLRLPSGFESTKNSLMAKAEESARKTFSGSSRIPKAASGRTSFRPSNSSVRNVDPSSSFICPRKRNSKHKRKQVNKERARDSAGLPEAERLEVRQRRRGEPRTPHSKRSKKHKPTRQSHTEHEEALLHNRRCARQRERGCGHSRAVAYRGREERPAQQEPEVRRG